MPQRDPAKVCELGKVLVTGGAGFVGSNFVSTLLERGYAVRSLDRAPSPLVHENLEVLQGDIRDEALLAIAVKGVDTIFHTAAVIELKGGSAVTQEYRDLSYSINVEATKSLVLAAQAAGVKRFVYTASNSVVIGGKPISNGDESLPYTQRFIDLYTETKVVAEKWVLAQNGKAGLLSCAVRPSSIWGAGDQTMFKKMFEQALAGLMKARIGNGSELLDNTFVHNLIHGQILAAQHLVEGGTAPGQAYFINDGEPVNVFVFSSTVFDAVNHPIPKLSVPAALIRVSLSIWQFLYFRFNFPEPPLAPMEIERVAYNNYFSIEKAKKDLGYAPPFTTAEGMEMSLPYYKELFESMRAAKRNKKES